MIIDYIVELGLDAIKSETLTAKQQQDIKRQLWQFIKRQEHMNMSCTREEELDFAGLAGYIRTNLLEDVQVLLFGVQKERVARQETVISKAMAYAQAKTKLSRERAKKMTEDAIGILRTFYRSQMGTELMLASAEIEDTIKATTEQLIAGQTVELTDLIRESIDLQFEKQYGKFVVTQNANIKPVWYFTGRETELNELRQWIEEGRKSVLVSSMGGIGKTQICRKLFDEYVEKYSHNEDIPFQHIGYVEYDGDMDSSLQKCLIFKQQQDPKSNQKAAWDELTDLASKGKLLLIIDNVNKSMKEDPSLKQLNSIFGAVVVTSRKTSFSDEFMPYCIDFLNTEQCREIYEKILNKISRGKLHVKPDELSDLNYIIEKLAGKHTITIELLAHLAATKPWTVNKLRKELEQKGFRLRFRKAGELINIQEEYEKLYDLSDLIDAEVNILEAFSVFPYIPLPVKICNQWLLSDAGADETDDILMGLYQKGWLQFDWGEESYAMHPVFAQFIYDKYKPNAKKHTGLIKACQDSLRIAIGDSALEKQIFIPFAESIVEKVNMEEPWEQLEFIGTYAYLLQYFGKYGKAAKLYNWRLEICKERFGENHSETAAGYNELGRMYIRQGEHKKAEIMNKESLEIRKKVFGETHLETAASYNDLGTAYIEQGKYEKAEEMYRKCLEIREEVLGENHSETAVSYNNLAGIYIQREEYGKAEELLEKAARIWELEKNDFFATSPYINMAIICVRKCKYKEAEELYERVLTICKKRLVKDHPLTATFYRKLVNAYKEQGEHERAKELYHKTIQFLESD